MFQPEVKSAFNEDISILIKLDNHSHNYICDCGDASGLTVKECQNTKAIFISHTHIDHFVNFDFILRHQIGIGERVIICGPEGITKQVQSKIRGYQWNLIAANAITYEIREVKDDLKIVVSEIAPPIWEIKEVGILDSDTIFSNEKFDVDFVVLDHKTNSIAYRFKEKDTVKVDMSKGAFKPGKWVGELKNAFETANGTKLIEVEGKQFEAKDLFYMLSIQQGDSLGVIMDHAANISNHKKIKSLFTNCNKVFIECFYKKDDKEFALQNYHSFSTESAKIMNACNVKNAIPVHFSRKYTAEEVEELLVEFNQELEK